MWNESLSQYGGALLDQSPVIDTTTDRPAYGMNQALSSNGGMTITATKAWVRFQPAGTGTPVVLNEWDMWSNGSNPSTGAANAASTVSRTSAGIYVITCPATVYDDIPAALPGVSGTVPGATTAGFAVQFNAAKASCESTVSSDDFECSSFVSNANQITVYIRNGSTRALADPTGIPFSVFAV